MTIASSIRFLGLVLAYVLFGVAAEGATVRSLADWTKLGEDLAAQGRIPQSVLVLGEVIARRPNYAPAQQALDGTFARLGSVRRSDRFLRYAIEHDRKHMSAYAAALQRLDRTHPFRISANFGVLPTSNLGHSSSSRYFVTNAGTFLISDGGSQKTGVGIGFGLYGDLIIHPHPGYRFRFRTGARGGWYRRGSLRSIAPMVSARFEALEAPAPWGLEAFARRRVYDGKPNEITSDVATKGLSFDKHWILSSRKRLGIYMRGEYRSYLEKPNLSGPDYVVGMTISRPLGDRMSISYGVNLERSLPRLEYQRFKRVSAHAGITKLITKSLVGGIEVTGDWRGFDHTFPLLGYARRDRGLSVTLSARFLSMKVLNGIPKVECTMHQSHSNVALYSYRSVDCGINLIAKF
ncbi:uncharacterized protein DUF560 [Thioclava sp. ES.031]|uniref:surface lipoprotein assembly modifier n=1 Tax=Thioclava sp. ES.031 TaxID=1798203 RepID=UPI000BF38925|nr:surface lipoprotein assembly modifier [Thioclava sp. ES.031]PFG62147.1 uncharacterized protein DUF560 [Thioclava sp. ES.031]